MEARSLSIIDGAKIGDFTTVLGEQSEGRFAEETNFKLYLENDLGETSEDFIVRGKYYSGRGEHYRPWIEFDFAEEVDFKSFSTTLSEEVLQQLFQTLSNVVPPSGWLFVIYENHEETKQELDRQVPPPASRIGFLLYNSGCVWFKNWYFAEGFREGRKKLQGEKPLNDESKRKSLEKLQKELQDFLNQEKNYDEKFFENSKNRAKKVMKEIKQEIQ